jgi:hypothetical protein
MDGSTFRGGSLDMQCRSSCWLSVLRAALTILACNAALAGCSRDVGTPDDYLDVSIAASVAAAGGIDEAFERVDQVFVRVTAGSTVVFDETQTFSPEDGARVRVRLDASLVGSPVSVDVGLLYNGQPMFRGAGSATLAESGRTTVEVRLDPVVAGVAMGDPAATFTAIGESLRIGGAAVFASGDTIDSSAIIWRTLDPDIVSVEEDGDAVALAEGEARVEATAGGVTTGGRVLVDPVVESIEVTPESPVLSVAETLTFQAILRDRNGNVIDRSANWSSSNEAAATIDAGGTALAIAPGITTITARSDDASGSTELTVLDVPASPAGLEAFILNEFAREFLLEWEDRSSNETHFSIELSVEGGDWFEVGQASPDATSFQGIGLPGENSFRVRACNAQGCSPPSNTSTLTFPLGPPSVTTLPSPDVGIMRGGIDDSGAYEYWFEYGASTVTPTEQGSGAAEVTAPVSDARTGTAVQYRVVARNPLGTSQGEWLSLVLPTVISSHTFESESFYAIRARIESDPALESPAERIEFDVTWTDIDGIAENATEVDTTPDSTSDGYLYEVEWDPPFPDNAYIVQVNVVVFFKSGAVARAPSRTFCWLNCPLLE